MRTLFLSVGEAGAQFALQQRGSRNTNTFLCLEMGALNSVCIHSQLVSFLLGTPLGGGMIEENTQLYREGYMIQTTNIKVGLGNAKNTEEADGDSIT